METLRRGPVVMTTYSNCGGEHRQRLEAFVIEAHDLC